MNRPELQSVLISPNPINAKQTLSITVIAEDVEIVFGTELHYVTESGEIYVNEEVGLI